MANRIYLIHSTYSSRNSIEEGLSIESKARILDLDCEIYSLEARLRREKCYLLQVLSEEAGLVRGKKSEGLSPPSLICVCVE